MGVSKVQSCAAIVRAYANSINVSFSSLPSNGNHIVARCFGIQGTATGITYSDNQSNSYAQSIWTNNGTSNFTSIGATTTPIGTPSGTFTVTFTGTGGTLTGLEGWIDEWTSAGAGNWLDKTTGGTATSATIDSGSAATTTQADEAFVAAGVYFSGGASTTYTYNVAGSAPSSGWTEDASEPDNTFLCSGFFAGVIVSSTFAARSVVTGTPQSGGLQNSQSVATFKGAAAANSMNITALGELDYPTSGPLKTLQIMLTIGTG